MSSAKHNVLSYAFIAELIYCIFSIVLYTRVLRENSDDTYHFRIKSLRLVIGTIRYLN